VSVNAGGTGFMVAQNNGGRNILKIVSCLEAGSGSGNALDSSGSVGTVRVTGCIFQNFQTGVTGTVRQVVNQQQTVTTGAPFNFTIVPPNAGTFYQDNGVFYVSGLPGAGLPLLKVAAGTVSGQGMYSNTGAVYTVDELTVGTLFVNYFYTTTVSTTVTYPGGIATVQANPLFLSTVLGGENLGLSGVSPAVDYNVGSGSSLVYTNAGLSNPMTILSSSTKGFAFDGLTFTGDLNFYDGLQIVRNLAAAPFVSYCSFTALGTQGLQATSGATVERCLFSTNGIGCNVSDVNCTVTQCVGLQCDGAFLVVFAENTTVNRCTAYRCEYGQINLTAAIDTVNQDNVFAKNYALDYQGAGTQVFSDVERISQIPGPAAAVSGSRRDPLFRDKRTPVDLRLQAIEAGFPQNSPAKGLAHDGGDAGAYAFGYPPLVPTWTLIDFALITDGVNPTYLETTPSPVKLAEGNTFGLVTFSDAPGFPIKRALIWAADCPMPDAQVTALTDLYTYGTGECQMSLDGGATFIAMRIVRSNALSRRQMQGLYYSNAGVPEPIGQLVFVEST
jgi:hypothetical protein